MSRDAGARFSIQPLDGPVGAEVRDLNVAGSLSPDAFERLHDAHLRYHVLVFRDQRITPLEQVAFSRRWGTLERHVLHQFALAGHPEILIVSNVLEDGRPTGLGDAGVYWHSDLSYKARPSLGSFLHAQELPPEGGDTLFANQHLAWGTLSPDVQQRLRGLRAEHSYLKKYAELQQRNRFRPSLSADQIAQVPPAVHPVVRIHPESGRPALFVNEHFTTRLLDLPGDDSDALLAMLYAHATQARFVYRHRWQPHDMVFWDNRSVQHLATGCPPEHRRTLYRTTIEGDLPV
jgi:alpha-ketoglutarate-dependent taurine dioxygenase